ncbi:MAG: penicillin acylase family protein [Candidatus Hydrogenedentes bacterium]|nr:penicillin acylase family protein [Candidatus Hydrogenedentota bacterium]
MLPIHPFTYRLVHRFLLGILAAVSSLSALAQVPPDPRALWEQATIYRDEWGVPHIQADSLVAMAFAFGYAQSDDHLEAMLKAYRIAGGRAAEVYGPEFADSDEFSLKVGHLASAMSAYPLADPVTRDLCEGFALGVNTWLVDHPGKAPEWADGVRPEEILALMHCYLMSFAPFDLPDVWRRAPAATTGNAWAVGPSRSVTGEPILAINPHADYRGPFQWYEAHLTVGDFNVAGATLFGLPMIMVGHNQRLGWVFTPNFTDFADVYLEPDTMGPAPDKDDPRTLLANRDSIRYLQMVANSRTYYVRQPGGMEERQVPYLDTPRGPIIGKHKGRFCSYLVGGFRDFGGLRQLFEMGNARNLAGFQNALNLHQFPCFHITYADADGNIFYVYNVKVGTKYWPGPPNMLTPAGAPGESKEPNTSPQTVNWSLPVPGGASMLQWGPLIPPGNLPAITNPASGYLQACGNPPWEATERANLSREQWPGWFAPEADSFRAQRVRRLLALGQRSFEDTQAMLYDTTVTAATFAVPWLKQTADENRDWVAKAHADLPAGLDVLWPWNYVSEPDSPGMTFFHVWWNALRAMSPGMGEVPLVQAMNENRPELHEPALRAAEEAAMLMRSEFGSLQVPWGDVHVFTRGDKTVPAPGSSNGGTIFVASDDLYEDNVWKVGYGYGFGMVVAFGQDGPRAASMVPFGASENSDSPHFSDQLELMKERRMKATRFAPDEVQRTAKSAFGSIVSVAPPGMDGLCTVRATRPVNVSTAVSGEPPAPVPAGLATYSVYVQVIQEPVTAESILEWDVYVAPELCAPENLPYLAMYAYDANNGWARLEAQEANLQTRTITCRDRGPRLYALLGPAEYRIAPDPAARSLIAQTIPTAPPPQAAPPADAPLVASAPAGGEVEPAAPVPTLPMPPNAVKSKVRQGAVAWGTKMQLRPPGVEGLVQMSGEAAFGARLLVSPDPPGALPEGLAAFSEYINVECSSKDKPVSITVNLRVQAEVCEEPAIDQLAVHVYDAAQGWVRLDEQQHDAKTRSFSAEDTSPRTYAVLGPQGLLRQAPTPISESAGPGA